MKELGGDMKEWQVGDVIRVQTSGGFRVWRIEGFFLGTENCEALVELRPLDLNPGMAHGIKGETVFVPSDLAELAQHIE